MRSKRERVEKHKGIKKRGENKTHDNVRSQDN